MTPLFDWLKEDKNTPHKNRFLKNNLTEVETKNARREICNTCDKRRGIVCGRCGCFIRAKTAWNNEICPDKKW